MAESERKSRNEDDREYQMRREDIYKNIKMTYQGKTHIPPEEIPDGMDYRWIFHSIFGDTTRSRMGEVARLGWTVVPPSRHPFLGNEDPLGEGNSSRPYILIGGNILCQRPKEFGEEERRLDQEFQIRQITQNPAHLTNSMSNPSMPVQVWANQTMNSRSFRGE